MPHIQSPPEDGASRAVLSAFSGRAAPLGLLLGLLLVLLAACGGGEQVGAPTLAVAVNGLPDDAPGHVTVRYEDGSTTLLTGDRRLQNLEPGRYTVQAAEVNWNDQSYRATPSLVEVVLGSASIEQVAVTYVLTTGSTDAGGAGGVAASGITGGNTVHGVLWNDVNGDGLFGRGDVVLSHTTVVLETESGEILTVETDRAGQYRFAGLVPGTAFTLRHGTASPAGDGLRTQSATESSDQNVKHYLWH